MAEVMAALENGDGQPALALLRALQPLAKCDTPFPLGSFRQEAQLAVLCNDAASVANSTTEIQQHFEELSKSSMFADLWTDTTHTPCA